MIGIAVAVIAVLIVAFFIVSEKVFERTNYYKNNFGSMEKLKGTAKVDFVNTGSTFAYYGIDYGAAGVKGLNLALCPQSIEQDFKMLKHYENRYNPGATVFIVISDLAFAKKEYEETITNEKYYKILNMGEIDGYSPLEAIRARYLPVLYSWKNFVRFLRDVRLDNEYELKVNENDQEAVEADANKRCKSWMSEFALADLSAASQGGRFIDTFVYTTSIVGEMVAWCKKRGLKPVIVNIPVASEMVRSFSQEFLNVFYYENIKKIVQKYRVGFIDLQKKEKLSDYLLYLDSCRLNKIGREIITKLLLDEVRKQ